MKRTRVTALAALVLFGAVATYLILQIVIDSGRVLPRLPWTSAPILLLLSAILLLTSLNVRRRLEELRKNDSEKDISKIKQLDPIFMSRLVMLAKSASHGGALLSGIYLGFAATYFLEFAHVDNQDPLWSSLLDLSASLLVAIGGYVLERVLTIKDDGEAI